MTTDPLTLQPPGLPVLRLVDAQAHDELLTAIRMLNSDFWYVLKKLEDFEQAERDLRERLRGKQLRIEP